MDLVITIDRSSSMIGQQLSDAQEAAIRLVESLDLTHDRAAVVSFARAARVEQQLSSNQEDLISAIERLKVSGGTDIASGINAAYAQLSPAERRPEAAQVIVILSDGDSDYAEALAAAQRAHADDVRIISIGLGTDVNTELLQSLVTDPGDYYYAPSSADLPAIYDVIGRRLSCEAQAS